MVYLAMLVHTAISAGTFLIAKRALAHLSAFELALLRFSLAALCYGVVLLGRRVRIARRDLGMLALLGFIGVPLNQGLFLSGLAYSTPAHAALLYALTPIVVAIIARIRLRERLSALKTAGILVAFAGVLVVLFSRGLGHFDAVQLGDLLILLGVLAWAFFAVLGKPYAERYGALASTGASIILGTLFYLPIGVPLSDFARIGALSGETWLAIGYLVLFTSVIAYFLYYWALARVAASQVAIFSNLQPVFTAAFAWMFLGERLTGQFLVGGALVIAGVLLTERG